MSLFCQPFSKVRLCPVSARRLSRMTLTATACILAILLTPVTSQAQQQAAPAVSAPVALPGLIPLRDDEDRLKIGPRAYLTRDPSGHLSYSTLIENHLGGRRGATGNNTILALGSKPVPSWVVFAVKNESRTNSEWILSLGGHADGRYGTIKKMFLYDHLSQRYAIYAMPDAKGAYPPQSTLPLFGTGVPFTLAPGQQALMVLYVVPEGGMPVTLVPEILSRQAFWESQAYTFNRTSIVPVTLLAALGIFGGLLVFSRNLLALPAMIYLGAQLALYTVQDQTAYSSFPLSSENTPVLFMIVMISAMMLAKFFLGSGESSRRNNVTFYGPIVANIILGVIALLTIPDTMTMRPAILMGLPLLTLVMVTMVSVAFTLRGRPAAGPFAASWFILVIGTLVSALSLIGTLPATSMIAGAYWISLLIQVPVLIGAVFLRNWLIGQNKEESENTAEEDADRISRIRQAKEGSENARLLRVIEHERQMLQDLRDREIEQNEAMRRAKETADMANRAKSAFLAVISHEIRTPMSGIMGMIRLLLDTQLNKDQRDYARTIQDSGDAMLALLNDILDFEKIESGKLDLEIIDFDLPRLLNDIITLMSGHASQKGIFLKSDLGPDIPRYVRGDPVRLRQVLLNLTGNALKFTAQGGVTLSLRTTDWDGITQPGWSRLTFGVRDTGIGISKDAQKNLFNPFSQADASISRKYGGTGLGLTICQRLIQAMGGEIAIDSIEGDGSTFHFTIAMEDGAADQVEDMSSALASRGVAARPEKVLNILCVDDNDVNQKLLKEFVTRMGHQPITAQTGEDAIETIRRQNIDMALMDIELPGISGMGATRAIRSLPDVRKASTPVIALTGHVGDEDIRRCYAANMNGHLAKPIDPDKLKIQIDKVIRNTLDNPVDLGDRDAAAPTFQPTNVIETVKKAEPAKSDNDYGVLSRKSQDTALEPQKDNSDTGTSVAPIHAYAMEPEGHAAHNNHFDLNDDDLDEDSFEKAIKMSEETTPNSTVFDHSMLDDLKKSMKKSDLQEMVDSLTSKNDEIIDALLKAMSDRDAPALMARGHELKGMCGNFGLKELSDIGGKIEKAAKDNSVDGLIDVVDMLPEANARAKQAITLWIAA